MGAHAGRDSLPLGEYPSCIYNVPTQLQHEKQDESPQLRRTRKHFGPAHPSDPKPSIPANAPLTPIRCQYPDRGRPHPCHRPVAPAPPPPLPSSHGGSNHPKQPEHRRSPFRQQDQHFRWRHGPHGGTEAFRRPARGNCLRWMKKFSLCSCNMPNQLQSEKQINSSTDTRTTKIANNQFVAPRGSVRPDLRQRADSRTDEVREGSASPPPAPAAPAPRPGPAGCACLPPPRTGPRPPAAAAVRPPARRRRP